MYRVVWRGKTTYALLNAYPYANGHVLVAPVAHGGDLTTVEEEVAQELMEGVRVIVTALSKAYGTVAFNVGANLGRVAGAGFADHLHFHVVPRWDGDTNFMTTVSSTRVIPEDLDTTASRVRRAVAESKSGALSNE
jgi:ATP adenylyltransferase